MSAALPLIVSTAGVAALVVTVGQAISVARFWGGGLPAYQAVDAAANSELKVIGITWLALFAIPGLLAVAITYLASPQGKATAAMYYALICIATVESLIAVLLGLRPGSGDYGRSYNALAISGLVVAAALAIVIVRRMPVEMGRTKAGKVIEGKQPGLREAARRRVKRADDKKSEHILAPHFTHFLLLGIVSFAASISTFLLLGHLWIGIAVLLTGVLGLVGIRIAELSTGIRWYAVAVFFSVAVFGAVTVVLRMFNEPRLQPVAFITNESGKREAVEGIYVGESDDRLWFASVALDRCKAFKIRPGSGRLRSVPMSKVQQLTIGAAVGLPKLAHESRSMLDDLMAERRGRVRVKRPAAVRDSVEAGPFDAARATPGHWVESRSVSVLGEHPTLTLAGERLLVHKNDEDGKWAFRVPRNARSGEVHAECGDHTNPAMLTVRQGPLAVPAARRLAHGWWRFTSAGSLDPDGEIKRYRWAVAGHHVEDGPRLNQFVRGKRRTSATLTVTDDEGLSDTRKVSLAAAFTTTIPNDVLFCSDCRRLKRPAGHYLLRFRRFVAGARRVVISGHTDQRGTRAYNLKLSRARARVVTQVLLAGARPKPRRRIIKGYGETHLIRPGADSLNRRVEIKIVSRTGNAG